MDNRSNRLILIQPKTSLKHYWQEIWDYKELFYVLAKRDIAVRYKQTIIGIAWSIIQPLLTLIVFTFVFNKIAKLPADGSTPYGLMVYIALIPWQFFSTSLSGSASSLIDNSNLISKVYFPRIIIPTAAIAVSLVDLLINIVVLAVLLLWFSFVPSPNILFLPLIIVMGFLASIGPGLWISSVNVKYRDFRYVIPFVIQLGLYISPVGFSSSVIPEKWRLLYSLNPMTGVIDGFRWCILGGEVPLYIPGFVLSWSVILVLLFLGLRQFRNSEKSFADNL